MFTGFPADGLQFLKQLRRNNTKEWFHANKATYDGTTAEAFETAAGCVRPARLRAPRRAAPESRGLEVVVKRQGHGNAPFGHDLEAHRIHQGEGLVVEPLEPVCDRPRFECRSAVNHQVRRLSHPLDKGQPSADPHAAHQQGMGFGNHVIAGDNTRPGSHVLPEGVGNGGMIRV